MNKIVFGDNRITMKQLIDEGVKVQMCVTSPPYYGLRDYGHENQIGLEQTPEDYINEMVNVFRLVKDLLTDDGTLWVNIGDSYSSGGRTSTTSQSLRGNTEYGVTRPPVIQGIKPKDLIGIPWMLAFALRADGWYLRQDIIWHKPNPMPESVRDRCTKAHEYIFLLSKSDKYFFDNEAIKEPLASSSISRLNQDIENQKGSNRVTGKTNGNMKAVYSKPYTGKSIKDYKSGLAQDASETKKRIVDKILSGEISGRNKRSVWTITTKPYKGAHFATFPKKLIEPCIKAGCPEKICVSCNTPYKRQKKVERNLTLDEVAEIRKNIVESNKDKKPYAILEEEFRNQVIEYRNLPNHDEMREYLQFNRHLQELTIDQIETSFGTQAPHHWFEKGGSYPSKEDWIKLKEMLLFDDKYDQAMTDVFYKSGLKCANNYIDNGLVKQCQCDTNETKTGIVFDPFMGSGTTAQVALELGRQYLGCELNPNYEALQQERINSAIPQQEDDSQFDLFKEVA